MSGKPGEFAQGKDWFQTIFFDVLIPVGVVLVVIAAVIGLLTEPTYETYDLADTLSEYIPLPLDLLAHILMGVAFGFLTAIGAAVLWFIAILVTSAISSLFAFRGSPDFTSLPERAEIEHELGARLSQAGISQLDSEQFLQIRRAFLNAMTKGVKSDHVRLNLETEEGKRFDLVSMGYWKRDGSDKWYWEVGTIYLFDVVIRPSTLTDAYELLPSLHTALRRLLPTLSSPLKPEDVVMRENLSFVFVGVKAEFDQIRAGPAVYSLSQQWVLNRHGARKVNDAFYRHMKRAHGIQFEQIGRLKTSKVKPAQETDETRDQTISCEQCGAQNEGRYQFCIKCGHPLRKGMQQE